jgi:16S rRNA C967 or C1407 C5-methylase (RsmB/RsmF family)
MFTAVTVLCSNCSLKQKFSKTRNEYRKEVVLEWFVNAGPRNLPISGTIMQGHTKQAPKSLRTNGLRANNA